MQKIGKVKYNFFDFLSIHRELYISYSIIYFTVQILKRKTFFKNKNIIQLIISKL
jgi:hypothetical protein